MIAVPVDTQRRNQACETVEQLERTEPDPANDVYDRTNYENRALTWGNLGDEQAMMA